MNDAQRISFDARRELSGKAVAAACYAPFASLYLDPRGDVLACCENTGHPLGNITETSLLDIWRGRRAGELRRALREYDLGLGCHFCAWQIEDGNYASTLTDSFAHLAVDDPEPAWPTRLEFAMSNTCNLECAMCNGEWSSTIRSRREGRAPLPKVYGDAFFEDLRPFLPHLSEVHFLGGEPLLATETLRVLDLIVDEGLDITCQVTTNGTQWNGRVARILELLPVSLAVSLDGVTRETVESIRVGASYDDLMANLARYRAYTRREGSSLNLTFCLMQQNWHEFGAYLRFADEWGCRVFVNTVMNPAFSLHHLAPDDLDAVVRQLEAEDEGLRAELTLNHDLWVAELDRLRAWRSRLLDARPTTGTVRVDDPVGPDKRRRAYFQAGPVPDELLAEPPTGPAVTEDDAAYRVAHGMVDARVSVLRCDPDGWVTGTGTDGFLGLTADECRSLRWSELAGRLGRVHGNETFVAHQEVVDGGIERRAVLGRPRVRATYATLFSFPEWSDAGLTGSVTVAAWTHQPPDWSTPTG